MKTVLGATGLQLSAPMSRKSVGKTQRFRILSRDRFACRYCGRPAAIAAIEVDHIFPVSKGGTNDDENLLAACKDCNAGKGARVVPIEAPHVAADFVRLLSIQRQKDAAETAIEISRQNEELRQTVVDFWCEKIRKDTMRLDVLGVAMSFVKQHGVGLVFEWIAIAAERMRGKSESRICKYMCGCRRKYLEALQ